MLNRSSIRHTQHIALSEGRRFVPGDPGMRASLSPGDDARIFPGKTDDFDQSFLKRKAIRHQRQNGSAGNTCRRHLSQS